MAEVAPWEKDWGASPAAAAPQADEVAPWDRQRAPVASVSQQDKGGLGRNLGAGFIENLTNIPDAFLDPAKRMYNAVRGALPEQEHTAFGTQVGPGGNPELPEHEIGLALNRGLGHIGLNPEDVTANTPAERISRMGGAGATALLFPEGAAEGLGEAGGQALTRVTSRAANSPLSTVARRTATGAAAGLGAGTAGEVVPDNMPVTKLVTQAAGAILAGGATEIPGMVKGLAPSLRRTFQPMTAPGREQEAADLLRQRSASPDKLLESLDQNPELVRNSEPTAGQLNGDMGLLSLEREQATKNPDAFNQRRTDQNAARRAALTGIQHEGDPQAVGGFLRGHFRQIDDQAQASVDALTVDALHQSEKLGGEYTPEQHGAGLRDALQQAENTARTRERQLWKAVDPDNSVRVDATPTFQAAQDIQKGMTRMAAPMEGAEKGIFDSLEGDKNLSLGELSDLRSRVSTAARSELMSNGNSPAYARLIRLRGSIQNNLADAAADKVAEQAKEVAAGTMPAEDTIASKIRGWLHDYEQQRAAGAAGVGEGAPAAETGVAGAHAPALPAEGGSSSAEGAEGLPESGGPRPLTEADAANLSEATKATKERAGTFGRGPVQQALAKAGSQDVYKLPEAKVPDKFFHAGPTSASDIRQLRKTIGPEKADALLKDFAAASFRKAAQNPDGTIDATRAAAWRRRFSGAMGEFKDLDAKFGNAATASEAIGEAAAHQQGLLRDRRYTALGQIAGAEDAESVVRRIGGILGSKTATKDLGDLATRVAGNPDAKQGLRQAIAEHISRNLISNTEAGTSETALIKSDQYQTFLRKNRAALAKVFAPEEMKAFDAIAADLQRANRSITAVKLPGQSNTPQDIHGIVKNNPESTVLDHVISEAAAGAGGFAVGHLPGAIAGSIGARVINNMRAAGMQKVDQLVTQALLDPVLMKNLLRRAPARAQDPIMQPISARLRRLAIGTAAALHGSSSQNQ